MRRIKHIRIILVGFCCLYLVVVPALAQVVWTEISLNPVLDVGPPGVWDSGVVFKPHVIEVGDTLKMWYAGGDQGAAFARPEIGYAWSVDGISWNRRANPVLLKRGGAWDAGQVENPVVIQDGDMLRMWYSGFGDGIAGESANKIGYAVSTDGLNWTAHSSPVLTIGDAGEWDHGTIVPASVVKNGSTYMLYYSAGEGIAATVAGDESAEGAEAAVVFLVGLATSEDGVNWTKYDNLITHAPPFRDSDPIMWPGGAGSWDESQIYRPSVLETEDGFEMWYAGMSMTGMEEIGYATSLDGLTWEKEEGNPVFKVSHSWAFSASDPTVVLMGDTYRMWFTGWPSVFPFRATIGSATAPVSDVTNVASPNFEAASGTFEVSPNYPNPFNPRTKISFELSERSRVRLEIFDVRGRKVRDLLDADFSAGRHYVTWDGAGNTGEELASGVYFYKLRAGGRSQTRKLTLLR